MKVQWKSIASAIVIVAAVAGPATAAAANGTSTMIADGGGAEATAATQSVVVAGHGRAGDGSYWIWGAGGIGGKTFSHYFRERSCHGATAVGKGTHRVTKVPGGKYAKAAVPSASSGNKAHYHNC